MLIIGWTPGLREILEGHDLPHVIVVGLDDFDRYADELADHPAVARVLNAADIGRVLPALSRGGWRLADFDLVYSDHEFTLVPSAIIARLAEARGMPLNVAVAARDKWLQKQQVQAAGIEVAAAVLVNDPYRLDLDELEKLDYPMILKPVSSASGRNVTHVGSAADVIASLGRIEPSDSDVEAFLLEQILVGDEYHADGLVGEDGLLFLSVSRYFDPTLDARRSGGLASIVLDPQDSHALYAEAEVLCATALTALGARNVAFHLEFFDVKGTLVYSECGLRTGGSYVTDAVAAKFGVNLRQASLELAIFGRSDICVQTSDEHVGWSYLPYLGRWKAFAPDVCELLERAGVVKAKVGGLGYDQAPVGLRRGGLVVITGRDAAEVRERVASVRQWFSDAAVRRATSPSAK